MLFLCLSEELMILNFNDELGERHFEFCFVGFILGVDSFQDKKGESYQTRNAVIREIRKY